MGKEETARAAARWWADRIRETWGSQVDEGRLRRFEDCMAREIGRLGYHRYGMVCGNYPCKIVADAAREAGIPPRMTLPKKKRAEARMEIDLDRGTVRAVWGRANKPRLIYKTENGLQRRDKKGGMKMVTLGELVRRLDQEDTWLRVYDLAGAKSGEQPEAIYDADAAGIVNRDGWLNIEDEDVILIKAVGDPDTYGPVVEVYI